MSAVRWEIENSPELSAREIRAALVAFACVSAALSIRLLLSHGWIGMRHDWTSVPLPGQMATWAAGDWYGWLQVGSGTPLAYPNDWLITAVYALLALILPAAWLSKFTLWATVAVLGALTYLMARDSFRTTRFAAAAAGLLAVVGPVTFNRVIAGQLSYLWAYALLPAFIICCRRITGLREWRWALLLFLVVALCSIQVQFFVILPLILLVEAALWGRSAAGIALSAFATAFALAIAQAATFVSLLSSAHALTVSAAIAPTMDWIRSNSAPFIEALQLQGYVTQYFLASHRNLGWPDGLTFSLGWVLVIALIVGLVMLRADPRARFGAALWLIGAYLSAGVHAPFSGWVETVYAHFRPMQLFRELYHWTALSELGVAMLLSCAISAVMRVRGRILKAAAAAVLCCIAAFCAPSLTGNWQGQIQVIRLSRTDVSLYAQRSAQIEASRTLWLPMDQPMRTTSAKYAGIDPMGISFPYSLWSYVLAPPLSQIDMALRSAQPEGLGRALTFEGVARIVDRGDIVSDLPAFLYRTYPQDGRLFAGDALRTGIGELRWPCRAVEDDVACTNPAAASILSIPAASAIVTPFVPLFDVLPRDSSPKLVADEIDPAAAVVVRGDEPVFKARLLRRAENLLDQSLILQTGDLSLNWAPVDTTWSYRYDLTKALDLSLATIKAGANLRLRVRRPNDYIVVAYMKTPRGGALQITLPGSSAPYRVRTLAPVAVPSSMVFPSKGAGPMQIANAGGEEGLRAVYELTVSQWRSANERYAALRARARAFIVYDAQRRSAIRAAPASARNRGAGGGILAYAADRNGLRYRGVLKAGTHAIVLRMQYAPAWQLTIGGRRVAQHGSGDINGNLWVFPPLERQAAFEIRYQTGLLVGFVHGLSAAALGIAFGAMLFGFWLSMRCAQKRGREPERSGDIFRAPHYEKTAR